MGDRSGSREAKGSSLKKSKSNPGAAAARKKKAAKTEPTTLQSQMPPVPRGGQFFDCASALLSRQFDRDRDRVISRAEAENVSAVLTWFTDIEKQSSLYDLCKANSGFCYFACGVHPDNIDRTNKKSHEGWLEKVEEFGRKPECVAVLTGLNMSREIGTHFPQEAMLRSACGVADKLLLPLLLHCTDAASLERTIELLREEEWVSPVGEEAEAAGAEGHRRIVLHDAVTACGGDVSKLQLAVDAGFYFIVSAVGLSDVDASSLSRATACVAAIPRDRLLSASDSPWRTPQNIPDAYLRTLRNEPCNINFVNEAISEAVSVPIAELNPLLKENALRVFGLEFATLEAEASAAVADLTLEGSSRPVPPAAAAPAPTSAPVVVPVASTSTSATAGAASEELEGGSSNSNTRGDKKKKGPRPASEGAVESAAAASDSAAAATATTTAASGFYSCQKCRGRLFNRNQLTVHAVIDSNRTVFKMGQEEGLCQSVVFVPTADADPDRVCDSGLGLKVGQGRSMTVECKACGVKLGKFCAGEAACACGAVVPGPVVRILTGKVDFIDASLNQEELLLRAKLEVEEIGQRALLAEEEDRREAGSKAKREKKGKIISRQHNKGNYSSFRNKPFIPNASRVGKSKSGAGDSEEEDEDEEEEEVAPKPVTKKGGKPQRGKAMYAVESDSDDGSDN